MKKSIGLVLPFLIVASIFFAFGSPDPLPDPPKKTKTLYLLRHAKSSHKDESLADIDRPLNSRGKLDAPMMANIFKDRNLKIEQVVASPSKRTMKTANVFCDALGISQGDIEQDKELYRCSDATMLDKVKGTDNDVNTLMIVGHNPAITGCANYLQADTTFEKVKTCAMVSITFETDSWGTISKKSGTLNFYDWPKKHADNGKKKKKK